MCPRMWRNTALWTWHRGQSTTSGWRQWRERERVLRLSASSTLCQRTTWPVMASNADRSVPVNVQHWNNCLTLSPSAAVGPESAVCDIINLTNVHLHAEAVSGLSVVYQSTMRTLVLHFSRISSGIAFRIKQKIFPPVPKPVIPDFTRFQAQNQVRDNNIFLQNPICVLVSRINWCVAEDPGKARRGGRADTVSAAAGGQVHHRGCRTDRQGRLLWGHGRRHRGQQHLFEDVRRLRGWASGFYSWDTEELQRSRKDWRGKRDRNADIQEWSGVWCEDRFALKLDSCILLAM